MPMILVKKNPRGKVIRELSSEEETAVKTVCGLKKPATMALHNLANDILREMREYDAWLQCDCIPGDSPSLFRILCKYLFSEVAVQAVTELDNKAAHCHTPVPQWHRPFL